VTLELEHTLHEYERAAENNRRRLSSTLDELAASLTPGRMLDEVLSYARAGGGDFLKGLGTAASANPVPTLLIGVGAAMFLSGKGRVGSNGAARGPRSEESGTFTNGEPGTSTAKSAGAAIGEGMAAVRSGIAGAASGVRSGVSSAGAAVSRTAAGIADEAASTLSSAREAVREAGSAVGGAASNLADNVSGYAASAREGVVDRGRKAFDESSRVLKDLRTRGTDFAQEQPLIVGALGIAIGAAVATLLPRTRTEDSLMGEASDSIKGAIGEAAGEQYREAKTAAENVATEAKASATRHGLSAAGAAEAIRTMADKAVSTGAKSSEKPDAGE
jgi:Protein of unknown function (DUF3618)